MQPKWEVPLSVTTETGSQQENVTVSDDDANEARELAEDKITSRQPRGKWAELDTIAITSKC